jgi:hypothetical protein
MERMSQEEFAEHCRTNFFAGYGFRKGRSDKRPESYQDLVDFIGDRLQIGDPPFTTEHLATWLLEHVPTPGVSLFDCADIDVRHVGTVLLIAELDNRDEYVASWPLEPHGVLFPPSEIIRELIEAQRERQS